MTIHTSSRPGPTYHGDRSPLTRLYAEQARLHLQLIGSRPTPDLLRQIARVEARLAEGGR